eukprot:GHVU01176672.1.p1 GENE.GHVU01176672.1~~GHVU01176672.1.p1  ORF type:complete len:250 (+),score=37.98 GHVU01176672.1:197-946(+)
MDAIRVRQSNNRQRGKAATQAGKAAKKNVWEVMDASEIQSRWHICIGAKKGLKGQLRMRMEDRALERLQQMGHLLQQTFDENSEKAIDIILDSNRQQLSSDTLPIKERMIASLDKMNITDAYSSLPIQRDSFYDESRTRIDSDVFNKGLMQLIEVEDVTAQLSKSAPGPDGLPYWVYGLLTRGLKAAVTVMYSRCPLAHHDVPKSWTMAKLYKCITEESPHSPHLAKAAVDSEDTGYRRKQQLGCSLDS